MRSCPKLNVNDANLKERKKERNILTSWRNDFQRHVNGRNTNLAVEQIVQYIQIHILG